MITEISTTSMLSELTITFPSLRKRPLCEFGKDYAGKPGVWTGTSHGAMMPDGNPLFSTISDGTESPYLNPPIHEAFEAWLSNRGWGWENYDGETIFLEPNSSYDWYDAFLEENTAAARCAPVSSDSCPF
jgi:hypothetical protein